MIDRAMANSSSGVFRSSEFIVATPPGPTGLWGVLEELPTRYPPPGLLSPWPKLPQPSRLPVGQIIAQKKLKSESLGLIDRIKSRPIPCFTVKIVNHVSGDDPDRRMKGKVEHDREPWPSVHLFVALIFFSIDSIFSFAVLYLYSHM